MKTKTKEMKLNCSLGEDHNSRTQKKGSLFGMWKCNYKFSSDLLFVTKNEKFAREMLHLFTCTTKNNIHFVADFITVYTKSVSLHVPGNIPLTFTEFYIVSTALTNVPFGIWRRTTFHCPDQDIFLRTTLCKFPLQCYVFDWRHKFTSGQPFPHQKNNNKQINKQTERMPKFGQVLGTEFENLSAWRRLIYFWRRGESNIPTS